MSYRNSRRIEKLKRLRAWILADKDCAEKKVRKEIRLNLVKIIQQKLQVEKTEGVKSNSTELSEVLVGILCEKINFKSPYKEILRELESKLAEVIMYDTNERIKSAFFFNQTRIFRLYKIKY